MELINLQELRGLERQPIALGFLSAGEAREASGNGYFLNTTCTFQKILLE